MKHFLELAFIMAFFSNISQAGLLNAETARKLAKKPKDAQNRTKFDIMDFKSSSVYIKKEVQLGSITELIDANTKILEGVSSTEGGEIINPHMAYGVQLGLTTVVNAEALTNLGDGSYADDLPAELLNAEFKFTQGEVVFTALGKEFINAGDTDVNNRYFYTFPFPISNTAKLRIKVTPAPGAQADAANKHYLSVDVKTIELDI